MRQQLTLTNGEIEAVENKVYDYLCELNYRGKKPSFDFVKTLAGSKAYRIWHSWGIVADRRFSTAYGAYMKAGNRALSKYCEEHGITA